MQAHKKILITALPLVAGLLIGIIMAQPQDNGIDYEVTPDITIEPRRSDVVEIVQGYERLMDRYMLLVERNMGDVNEQIAENTETISQMAEQLDTMNARLLAIAEALEVELPDTGAVEQIPLEQNQPQPQQQPQEPQQQIELRQRQQDPRQQPESPQRQSRRAGQLEINI